MAVITEIKPAPADVGSNWTFLKENLKQDLSDKKLAPS